MVTTCLLRMVLSPIDRFYLTSKPRIRGVWYSLPMKKISLFIQSLVCWWNPGARGNLSDAQIILTQAASDMADGTSSKTNKLLAEAAQRYAEQLKIPIFAQGEVARVLDLLNVEVVGRTPCEAIPDNFGSGEYQGTDGVAKVQKKYCDQHGFTRILMLAASPHTWRAKWTYEKLGFEVILPPKSPPMISQKGMNQKRWSRYSTAYPYELGARLKYLFIGLI